MIHFFVEMADRRTVSLSDGIIIRGNHSVKPDPSSLLKIQTRDLACVVRRPPVQNLGIFTSRDTYWTDFFVDKQVGSRYSCDLLIFNGQVAWGCTGFTSKPHCFAKQENDDFIITGKVTCMEKSIIQIVVLLRSKSRSTDQYIF